MSVPKVALYARVSTSKDQSPAAQIAEMRLYCQARGWVIVTELADVGYSGASSQRPGLNDLLNLAYRRQIDIIVILKLDRLFRSLRHLIMVMEDLRALGVCLVAIRDNFDFSTPTGKLLAQVLGILAEFERALIIERTRVGLEHTRRIGKKLGRPRKRDDEVIRRMRSKGFSYRKIAIETGTSLGAVQRALSTSVIA